MKHLKSLSLFSIIGLFISLCAHAHGGDDGPSTLEQEFAKLSHIHLPMNYSTHHGLIWGYEIGAHDGEENDHNESEGIDVNLHPVLFGGFDKIRRYVCLESAQNQAIESCPESAPHLLVENKKWDLGVGGEVDYHLTIPYTGVGGGITYLRGKNYISMRTLNNKNEIRAKLNFPTNETEFSNWRVGDQLTYMSKGSVIINVFIGVEPFFHMGPEVIHTGIHRVTAKKTTESTLQVEFANMSSNSMGVEANAIIMNAEGSKSSGNSNSITYEFNITSAKDFNAIAALFAGRLDVTNKSLSDSNVKVMLKNSIHNKGASISGNFGFPILFFNGGSRGIYHSNGELEETEEDENKVEEIHHHQIYSSTRLKEHFTRGAISKHAWENRTLITTVVRDEHHPDESILSVAMNWSFSRDEVKDGQFKRKLRKLARQTGIDAFNSVRLPWDAQGYLKLDASINLSGGQVLAALSEEEKNSLQAYQSKNDYQGFNKSLLFFMNSKFKAGTLLMNERVQPKIELRIEGENVKKTTIQI